MFTVEMHKDAKIGFIECEQVNAYTDDLTGKTVIQIIIDNDVVYELPIKRPEENNEFDFESIKILNAHGNEVRTFSPEV